MVRAILVRMVVYRAKKRGRAAGLVVEQTVQRAGWRTGHEPRGGRTEAARKTNVTQCRRFYRTDE
ncbi:hypothetical protein BHT10_28365 [Burkholderia pseudomallei]|nr:hypothetical protein BHT10_28365 [Burkholderia pseudomallei]PPF07780.1 hypothetical protein B9D88_007875 [Burkholderia pseudomallei]BEH44687.1 hypothetical protein KNG_38880 [Burkholderia pseudomallei]